MFNSWVEKQRLGILLGRDKHQGEKARADKRQGKKSFGSSRAKITEFEKDYTALLLSLASSIRTGLDPLVALSQSGRLFEKSSVMQAELEKFSNDLNSGKSEEEAIRSFASSIAHPDIELFRTAFLLARKEGSSLSHCLERLARVTRQRQSFRRKIRASIAMQRLSTLGISAAAAIILGIQAMGNYDAFVEALKSELGFKIFAFGCCCLVAGFIWMMNLAKSRV